MIKEEIAEIVSKRTLSLFWSEILFRICKVVIKQERKHEEMNIILILSR